MIYNINDSNIQTLINTTRSYMRDFAGLNRLIEDEETNDRTIYWAIVDAIDNWNSTPPKLKVYSLAEIPISVLLRKIAANVIESLIFMQARNYLNFMDGGIRQGWQDKTPMYQSILQILSNQYETNKKQIKTEDNIEAAFTDGVPSEYAIVNGSYYLSSLEYEN